MATVDTSGDPIKIIYSVPVAAAAEFKSSLIEFFGMDPASTNVQIADRIAQDIRERIRASRRASVVQAAIDSAEAIDPGTIDFT